MLFVQRRKASSAHLATAGWALVAATLASTLPHAQAQSNSSTAAGIAAQRVVIDPATGRPRAPEFDELATAPAAAGAPQAMMRGATNADMTGISAHPALKRMQAAPTQARLGAVGQRFKPGMLALSIAKRDAAGSISTQCVTGPHAVATAFSTPAVQDGGRHDH